MTNQPLFAGYGIEHSYGGRAVLKSVSIELFPEAIVALLGPNGCGKSTLLKILAGILPLNTRSESGQVRYRGFDFLALSPAERARSVAYVAPDLRAEFPLTAFEAVMMGRSAQGIGFLATNTREDRDAAHWAMDQCRCWAFRDRDLHTLSGGERQLVALARALTQGAKVLLLDETLSRMDLNHQALMGALLRKLASQGYAIVLVAHDVNLASEWADLCLLLKEGQEFAFGPTREVLTDARICSLYPGAELHVAMNPITGTPKVFFGAGK